jgi:gamma-glutamylcyclotransferase (GGCT)/AIG2-like uncharacterized protein YtfP
MQNGPGPGTTDAAPSSMEHLVFVFGTLKEGFPNFTVNRGVRVPGSFSTCSAYPLYLVAAGIRKGPLGEYSHDHAALYRPRS